MKRLYLILLPVLVILGFMLSPRTAAAFNANNVMDDGVFDNVSSMNAAQIDSWLNQFPNSCISTNNGFAAPDPTGYSPHPSQFFYSGSPVSAGQIIYDTAQAYSINPQVLLATLQKEESLVDGGAGCASWQYTSALGYGCTDSGTNSHNYSYPGGGLVTPLYYKNGNPVNSITNSCVNSGPKAGFSEQLIHAAWLLTFSRHKSEGDTGWAVVKGNWNNCDDNNTCPSAWGIPASDACYSGYMIQGTFKRCPTDSNAVFYDGYTTIDGSSTHIDTGATAAFYVYTPHFSGNQSFDNLFQSWFGTIYVPQYSWQVTNLSYTTGGAPFNTGIGGSITVTVKNMGNVMWYNGGPFPVRLGVWDGSNSPLYTNGWVAPNRPAAMSESQVAPGATGTFTFPISASAPTGTFFVPLNLVLEGSGWMPWNGFTPRIQVNNGYGWSVQNVNYSAGSGIIEPGSTQHITIHALNTGAATWSNSSGPSIRLGEWGSTTASPVNYNWLSPTRAATMDEASVAPGAVGTFQFDVRVPATGNFYDRLNLVAEGYSWFNDAGLTLYLRGGVDSWKPLWSAYSLGGNANIHRGTSFDVIVKAQNTGELPWSNAFTNGLPQIRLATAAPIDRSSFLYDSSWISQTRTATLQESVVQPGQQGTFVFHVNVTSNAPLGPRNERFSLVAEGEQWFNDPGFSLYINVIP
jgi:hypothetical protein